MGEAKQKRSATLKFIERFPQCCFCGGSRSAVTREHMPPKALFDGSIRPDKLVMPSCDECNRGTSSADLVASIVSRWNYNSSEIEREDHHKLVNYARIHLSDVHAEWRPPTDVFDRIKMRQHLQLHGIPVPEDAGLIRIGSLTVRQLNLFAYKATIALYFEHFQKPLPDSGAVSAYWRTKEDFAQGVPKELLEMMRRYGTLEQGRWNAREVFEYRYEINEAEGLFICLARLRGGLYVGGFAVTDDQKVRNEVDQPFDWIKPSALLGMLDKMEFKRKR